VTAPAPRSFGKYLLEREIARGGMARVHLATLRGLGGFEKKLVVKEILPELASDPRFVAMFVEEAKVLVALSHPNIVPVYELGIVDGTYFLAMEHVDGATLADLVEKAPLSAGQAARVGAQVADALAYAHERFGIVHRDVSPRNVMVDVAGHTRLLDFGIAARAELEDDDALYGTPGFLSPEQARGERLTPASDLFSLGCVLHFAVTGKSPFAANDIEAVRGLAEAPVLALGEEQAGLASILSDLLAPTPDRRPASARSVARTLSALSVALDGTSDEDTAAQRLAALATEVRTGAPRESDLPSSGDPPTPTEGRVETLAKSQALDAMLGAPRIAPPSLDAEDAPRTAKLERSRKPAGDDAVVAQSLRPAASAGLGARVVVGLLAGLVAFGLVSLARFEVAPVAPLDATDHGLTDPADIAPLPIIPEDASVSDAAAEPVDAGDPDAGAMRARDAGVRAAGTGSISVRAMPWAQVTLDGRSLGTTPIRRASLAAGSHTIRLECPPLGRRVDATFRAEAGHAVEVTADLDRDPPTVHVAP
jgi:serine/threonine protein kinase